MNEYMNITDTPLADEIAKAFGLSNVRRTILDIQLDGTIHARVELVGDKRLYNIDFSKLGVMIEPGGTDG